MRSSIPLACLLACVFAWPASAQTPARSSWGVTGSFVPEWHVPSSLEVLAAAHFNEDHASIGEQNLKGQELRIGIARGRSLSGDWGVSFVRRTYENATVTANEGGSCSGSGLGGVLVLQCEDFSAVSTRRDVVLKGVEVHKFIPFVTINRVLQVGLNVAGGVGSLDGRVDSEHLRTSYTCTRPFDAPPDFSAAFPACAGGTVSNVNTVHTGSSTDGVSTFLTTESTLLPIGKVELAVGVIVTPRFKVRVAGGFNHPGVNAVSMTGVYFFGTP